MKRYTITEESTPQKNRKIIDWEEPTVNYGESHIDATGWRPDAEIARAAILSGKGTGNIGVYDFPDGIDTGFRRPQLQGADIVDIENQIKAIDNNIKDTKQKAEAAKQQKQAIKDAMTEAIFEANNVERPSE